jgi:phage/plasmid-associated DNA primase
LIQRHETEFRDLHTHLKSVIGAIKRKAETKKLTAQAMLKKRNAFNATTIIESVSQTSVSPATREKVLQAYSPRSKSIFTSPRSLSSGTGVALNQESPP